MESSSWPAFTVIAVPASSVAGRSGTRRSLAAVMPDRAPVCVLHRGCCCIVMLVASSPTFPGEPGPIVAPVALVGLSVPFGRPDRQSLDRQWKPAGPVRRVVGLRRAVPSAWRFRPSRCTPSGLPSLAGRTPAVSSGACSTLPKQGFTSLHPSRGNSANSCTPLAASAVRQARSKDRTRRVFRRCCGHRCRFVRVKILHIAQGLTPALRLLQWS
jgi:hypothetical protein